MSEADTAHGRLGRPHKAITTTTSAASMTATLTARPVARDTAATPYAFPASGGRIMTVRTSP